MRTETEDRAVSLGKYIIETKSTVRAAAGEFSVSKSTVHKDVTERLPQLNEVTASRVRSILDKNKAQRHLRGGEATRRKYLHLRDAGR